MVNKHKITKGTRSISIRKNQSEYIPDVENYFDIFFSAVDEKTKHLDFSKPRLTKLRGWDFPVWLPSYTEPVSELVQYLNHANLKSGDTAIDGGGFAGITAMLMALEVGPSGKVICIEPDPQNAECLTKNFNLFFENYGYAPTHINAALWSKDGSVIFSSDSAMGSSATEYVGERGEVIEVPCISLTTLTKDLPTINYVKLDIEGAEFEVLKDTNFWMTKRPRVSIECHGNAPTIEKRLNKMKYKTKELSQPGSQFVLLNGDPL